MEESRSLLSITSIKCINQHYTAITPKHHVNKKYVIKMTLQASSTP